MRRSCTRRCKAQSGKSAESVGVRARLRDEKGLMKRVAHRFVRSSFLASVIDSMRGLGARPVLHTRRPKFTRGANEAGQLASDEI